MSNKDLISIIVPLYNSEKYLSKCIDSIISQTYKNLEIILINDGSTDNSLNILNKYIKKDKRINLINKENGGASTARNIGLKESKGKYISFIDADDYVEKDYIEKLYESLIKNNADMAICDFYNVNENNEIILNNSPIKSELLTKKDFFKKTTIKDSYYYIVPWNKLYSRKIIEKIKYPEGKINEDEFVIHLIVDNCEKIISLSDKLYYYLRRDDGVSGRIRNIHFFDVIEALIERINFFKKTNNFEFIDQTTNVLLSRFYVNKAIYNREDQSVDDLEHKILYLIDGIKPYLFSFKTKLKIKYINVYKTYINIRFKQ